MIDTDVNIKLCLHCLRSLEKQGVPFSDDISDIVRQAAVCIGNIPAPLQYYDFQRLIQSSEPGGGGCSACHSADYQYLFSHFLPSDFYFIDHIKNTGCTKNLFSAI